MIALYLLLFFAFAAFIISYRPKPKIVKSLSATEWEAIKAIARKMRDYADQKSKPSARLSIRYEQSWSEARAIGYGGSIHEWKGLCRRVD